ncbi:MAG: cytochrome P450 [Pirellulaceae bacterium]
MSPPLPSPQGALRKSLAMSGLRDRPLDFILDMADQFGDLVHFESRQDPMIFVNHPELAREVLISRPHAFVRADAVCDALRIFDGDSILVTEGDLWRQQRRLLQEGFRAERLRGYAHEAAVQTREMLRQWPSVGSIPSGEEMAKLCTNTLFRIVLGTQSPAHLADSIRIVLDARAVEAGRAIAAEHPQTTGTTPGSDQALARVQQFLDQLICSRRREPADQEDILSMLVRSSNVNAENGLGQARDDLRIRDETISMINASLDATTSAMHWALCLVAKHQDAQARLRQELTLAVAQRQEMAAETAELPFTEMVVHESLRLYPPNWMLIPRRCQEESNLGGDRIPRGSWLYIFPYVMHRDARWFTQPALFDPDRFAPEKFGAMQRTAYMPLGLGPHVCLGKALSTIILTTMLACILREFCVSLPPDQPDVEPVVGIVVSPRSDLRLNVRRLDTSEQRREL